MAKKDNVVQIKERPKKIKIGILGDNELGDAMNYAFIGDHTTTMLTDKVEDILSFEPPIVYVTSDFTDFEEFRNDIIQILENTDAMIVIRSNTSPDQIDNLSQLHQRVVYWPDLSPRDGKRRSILIPSYLIVGGQPEAIQHLEQGIFYLSRIIPCPVMKCTAVEAAFSKALINTFLGVKLSLFNQFHEVVKDFGGNFTIVARNAMSDPRVGASHTNEIGWDGRRGYDVNSSFGQSIENMMNFAANRDTSNLTIVEKAAEYNNQLRGQDVVDNGQIEEEL